MYSALDIRCVLQQALKKNSVVQFHKHEHFFPLQIFVQVFIIFIACSSFKNSGWQKLSTK